MRDGKNSLNPISLTGTPRGQTASLKLMSVIASVIDGVSILQKPGSFTTELNKYTASSGGRETERGANCCFLPTGWVSRSAVMCMSHKTAAASLLPSSPLSDLPHGPPSPESHKEGNAAQPSWHMAAKPSRLPYDQAIPPWLFTQEKRVRVFTKSRVQIYSQHFYSL